MKNKSVKTMVASVLAVGLMMSIPAVSYTHLTLPTKLEV